MTVLANALRLGEHGYAVFPCSANKAPTCPHGHKAATSDATAATTLWCRWPGALIGTPTGCLNDFDVLDVDPRHGGDAWYNDHQHLLPATRIHQTRGGGLHLFFKHRHGVRNSAGRIAPGIDVRGEGGFIIWWPAAGGATLSNAAVAHWPDWLLKLLLPCAAPPRPAARATLKIDTCQRRVAVVLARTLTRLEMAQPGQRHERLRAAACTLGGLMDAGGFSVEEAEQKLMDAVRRAGGSDIVDKNARATIRWGLERGRAAPLQLEQQ